FLQWLLAFGGGGEEPVLVGTGGYDNAFAACAITAAAAEALLLPTGPPEKPGRPAVADRCQRARTAKLLTESPLPKSTAVAAFCSVPVNWA
ncbi:hypothetical protein AB4Z54_62650, partial [Streptomyces sp. MCAF7]